MDANARRSAAEKIHERAPCLRGRFLNLVAVIERELALILTDHFYSSDAEKGALFRLGRNRPFFTLRAKREVLPKMVKNDYPEYWDQNREVLKNLEDIAAFRNKRAHSIVDVSDPALARPIQEDAGFVDWEGGNPITDADFEDWEVKANMVLSCPSDVKRLLPFQEKRGP